MATSYAVEESLEAEGLLAVAKEKAMEAHAQDRIEAKEGPDEIDAAAEALHWAETAADGEDFSLAVMWLDRAGGLLGGLPASYKRRRRAWRQLAAG